MKIYLGVDHQGVKCKEKIVEYLTENGFDVETSLINNNPDDDYPDFAYEVCQKVLSSNGVGILVCGTGIGMSIAANKIKGIRCARVTNGNEAFTARNHNGANVIAFSAHIKDEEIYNIIDNYIDTKGPSEPRHLRRLDKIKNIEEGTYEY